MDQGLKQRLVGASVLIGLGVLVIPWLLDGSGMEVATTERKELPTPEARDSEPESQQNIVVEPRQAAEKPESVSPAKQTPPKKAATANTSKPKIRPAAASDPDAGWVAQVGSFSSEENANRLTASLKKEGYPAFVMRHSTGSGAMYRVRVGPERARDTAEELARRLAKDGHASKVVSHP